MNVEEAAIEDEKSRKQNSSLKKLSSNYITAKGSSYMLVNKQDS